MRKSIFTAQELYAMACLTQKQKIYGIPDLFGEDRNVQLQEVIDSLTTQQIANVDIDGNVSLADEYHTLVAFVCECDACITIHQQTTTLCTGQLFWKRSDRYLSAQWLDGAYAFAWADPLQVQAFFEQSIQCPSVDNQGTHTTIPQIALTKAHRLCADGQTEEALRMLRQNSATERIASVITDGFMHQAYYAGLMYMHNTTGTCKKTELAYLLSRDVCLQLSHSVQGIRTSTLFSEIEPERMRENIQSVVSVFLQ